MRRRAKTCEGAHRHISPLCVIIGSEMEITLRDILRASWISQMQDHYGMTDEHDMEYIIQRVDEAIAKLSDSELADLL